MDTDEEMQRLKLILSVVGVVLVSAFFSWTELSFFLRGQEAQADITDIYEVTQRGRFGFFEEKSLEIQYTFTEPGSGPRKGSFHRSLNWRIPEDGKVAIDYLPGAYGTSRGAGDVNWTSPMIFGLSIVGAVGSIYWIAKQASNTGRPRRPGRKI